MSKIKKPLYIIFCVVFTLSCGQQKATINDDEILYGLASPITINSEDSTTILLQDYFIKPETVDSVSKPIG